MSLIVRRTLRFPVAVITSGEFGSRLASPAEGRESGRDPGSACVSLVGNLSNETTIVKQRKMHATGSGRKTRTYHRRFEGDRTCHGLGLREGRMRALSGGAIIGPTGEKSGRDTSPAQDAHHGLRRRHG